MFFIKFFYCPDIYYPSRLTTISKNQEEKEKQVALFERIFKFRNFILKEIKK